MSHIAINLKEYIGEKMLIQENLLRLIEESDNIEENQQILMICINQQKITKDIHEFGAFLSLIAKISNNHTRTEFFYNKIAHILKFLKDDIKHYFSNNDVFTIFKGSKRMLLVLIDENILSIDQKITSTMKKYKYKKSKYPEFFCLPGFESNEDANFNQKRYTGENDIYLQNYTK